MATRDEMATSFGAAAGAYDEGRPDYPAEAVAWLLEPAGPRPRVADIGAGTGKLTKVVATLGADVIAVDPDAAMLARLRDVLPGVQTLVGAAETLILPDESLDAAVLGQAWHWVDPVAGSAEIGRVLRPGGVLGLIWNIRDESVPWVARLTAIMKGSHAEQLLAGDGPVVASPFGPLETRTWRWQRPVTRQTLTAMVHSRSYIITAGVSEDVERVLHPVLPWVHQVCGRISVLGNARASCALKYGFPAVIVNSSPTASSRRVGLP
ncbi:class I SAM-dependent methyltransferase [Microbacterium aurum]